MFAGIAPPSSMIVAIRPHGHNHQQRSLDDDFENGQKKVPPTSPSPEPLFCMTLDELLEVIAELLPDEVILCTKLLERLRSSRCLAASPLSADAEDVYRTFEAFVDSQQNTDSRGIRYLQQRVNNFNSRTDGPNKDVMPAVMTLEPPRNKAETPRRPRSPRPAGPQASQSGNNSGSPSEDGVNGGGNDKDATQNPSEGERDLMIGGKGRPPDGWRRLPFLPGPSYGGLRERCFVLFDDASQSLCGKIIDILVLLAIAVSTVSFVMESMPDFRHRPKKCAELRAAGLRLTKEACEPKPDDIFYVIEAVCIAVFTIEYLTRVVTVHATATSQETGWKRTLQYLRQPMNIIDLLAIIPFYVDLMLSGSEVGAFAILRLFRILRLFKLAKQNPGMRMFVEVMVMSGQPLSILVFFNVIITVMFGSLIFFAEGQKFSVADDFTKPVYDSCTGANKDAPFPMGVYVRPDQSLKSDEPTPFRSIPYSLWWVCVTMTTVGYGDYSPTTPLGKLIGVACFYVGIIFLALPISVLGTNFEIVYDRTIAAQQAKRAEELRKKGLQSPDSTQKVDRGPSRKHITAIGGPVPLFPSQGSILKRIFILFEDSSASKVGKVISVSVLATILVSTVAFVMESMPEFNNVPDDCDPNNLTVKDCEPVPEKAFFILECVCITIFTIDYTARVLTVHTACENPEECGLNPNRKYTKLTLTFQYCMQWLNIIDFVAIVPFYVSLTGAGGGGAGVLRVLRLIRVFRVLKMPQLRSLSEMFINVVMDAMPALFILFFMTSCSCVLFASCLVFAEGSNYSFDHFQDTHPEGVYIRPTKEGYGVEVTPFTSILYAFWWFFTTATTVGYGDDYPTTTAGRIVGVITFYAGIILLALPVTIVGGSFGKFYPDWVKEFKGGADLERIDDADGSSVQKLPLEKCEVPPPATAVVIQPADKDNGCPDTPKEAWS